MADYEISLTCMKPRDLALRSSMRVLPLARLDSISTIQADTVAWKA